MAVVFLTIPVWFPLIVLLILYLMIASPEKLHRGFKHARERRRAWTRLANHGRVLDYARAKSRVESGNGTFIVETWGAEIAFLWWIKEARRVLDPLQQMPSLNDDEEKRLARRARRALEACALFACSVEAENLNDSKFDEISNSPNIMIEESWFQDVALTGKVSDPLAWPTGDPVVDALRDERERLLDLKDYLVRQAEYERAAPIVKEIAAIEVKMMGLHKQVRLPASEVL